MRANFSAEYFAFFTIFAQNPVACAELPHSCLPLDSSAFQPITPRFPSMQKRSPPHIQNMKKLLICCLFGNTANSLAKKMQSLAEREGYPLMISAVGLDNFASVAPAFDGFLIAPHIQYKLDEIKETVGNTRSIAIIESLPYASLDARNVLNFVKEQMPELAA